MIGLSNLTNMSNVNDPKGMKKAVLRGGALAVLLLLLWAVIAAVVLVAPMGLGFLITRAGHLPFPDDGVDLWLLFQRGIIPALFMYGVVIAGLLWRRVHAAPVTVRAGTEAQP